MVIIAAVQLCTLLLAQSFSRLYTFVRVFVMRFCGGRCSCIPFIFVETGVYCLCYVALRTLATKQYFRSFFRYIRRCTIVSIVPNNNDYDDDDDDDDDDAFRCDNCLIIVDARV